MKRSVRSGGCCTRRKLRRDDFTDVSAKCLRPGLHMRQSSHSPNTVIAVAIAAAVSVALPGFLVGGLSVQIRGEFGVAEGRYGWAMSTYFLAATAGSIVLGRLAQVIGPRRQLTLALLGAAVVDLCIALFANEYGYLIAFLAIAGLCNAAAQTAVNLGLAQAGLPRLGLALAVKQSGMPAASMLSGLAVPVIALTLGWRWAFTAWRRLLSLRLLGCSRPFRVQRRSPPRRRLHLNHR